MVQKKLQNLNDNFDPNIYTSLNIFVSQNLQIFSAFQRDALHKCSWSIQETSVILLKLVRNWNIPISPKYVNSKKCIELQTMQYIPFLTNFDIFSLFKDLISKNLTQKVLYNMILNNHFVLEILAYINKGMFELHKFILN